MTLREDLAATTGASLVGFAYPATSAAARTVDDRLDDDVSVFDFIPASLHAGIRDNSNTTDLATYLAAAIAFEKGNRRGLKFPAGTYRTSVALAFGGTYGVRFFGEGAVTLHRHTGAGPVALIDSGGDEIRTEDVTFENFILKGNAQSTYGLDVRNIHRSRIARLRILDVVNAAVRVRSCVSTTFKDLCCSNNVDTFTTIPDTGLLITQVIWGGAPARTTACTFDNIVMEGPFGNICLDLEGADLCTFTGGAFEGAARGGVIRPESRGNVFLGTDFEANSVYDVEVLGKRTTFIGSAFSSPGSAGTVLVQPGAEQTSFFGGFARRIFLDAASLDTKLIGASVSSATGEGVTGTGAYESYASTRVDNALTYVGGLDRGAFTPTVYGGTAAGTQSYGTRAGYAERNGSIVTFNLSLTLTANSGGTGNAQIELPQQCRNQSGLTVELPCTTNSAITFSGANNRALLRIAPGDSFGTLIQCQNGGNASALPIGSIGAGTITIGGSYAAARSDA